MSKFEINAEGFRSVDVFTEVVGCLQFGAPASLLMFVVVYSPRFDGTSLTDYCVPQCNRVECSPDVGDDIFFVNCYLHPNFRLYVVEGGKLARSFVHTENWKSKVIRKSHVFDL